MSAYRHCLIAAASAALLLAAVPAQASGARQGVTPRPGEMVLLRDVSTRTAYRRVEQRLTVQAATALAKAALEEKRAQELPGATIINACVTVEVTPDTVTAVGAYTVQVQSLQTDRDRA